MKILFINIIFYLNIFPILGNDCLEGLSKQCEELSSIECITKKKDIFVQSQCTQEYILSNIQNYKEKDANMFKIMNNFCIDDLKLKCGSLSIDECHKNKIELVSKSLCALPELKKDPIIKKILKKEDNKIKEKDRRIQNLEKKLVATQSQYIEDDRAIKDDIKEQKAKKIISKKRSKRELTQKYINRLQKNIAELKLRSPKTPMKDFVSSKISECATSLSDLCGNDSVEKCVEDRPFLYTGTGCFIEFSRIHQLKATAVQNACSLELANYCSSTESMVDCFTTQKAKLSFDCRSKLGESLKTVEKIDLNNIEKTQGQCLSVMKKFCPTVLSDPASAQECLKEYSAEIQKNCQ